MRTMAGQLTEATPKPGTQRKRRPGRSGSQAEENPARRPKRLVRIPPIPMYLQAEEKKRMSPNTL